MAHMHPQPDKNLTRLTSALIVTATFMLAEVAGGIISGSLALLADAGHMLTDTVALLLARLAVQFAQYKSDERHSFGLLRLTTLAAFVNALALLVLTLLIVWQALRRFWQPHPLTGGLMLLIAVAGLLANLLSFWLLHQGGTEENLNVKAAILHVVSDLFGSVAAICAAVVILLTGWTLIDPILSLFVSLLVVRSSWLLLCESFHELLEGAPRRINVAKLRHNLVLTFDEVRNVHHVHIWQIGEKSMITLHVQVIPAYDHDVLLHRIHQHLHQHYQIEHATVQMEYQPCRENDCQLTYRCQPVFPHH